MVVRKVNQPRRSLALSSPPGLDSVFLHSQRPVGAASAAAFRIMFGLLGFAAVIRFAAKGWINELYVEPAHHFTYVGFGWVQPWPVWGMYLHFALLALASLGVALGYRYRLSITAFFLLFTYIELIDKTTYLNHYYWVSLVSFLMIFLPLQRRFSLDAWRKLSLRSETIPVWVLWVLCAQVGVVYVFGGLAKLNPDWLFHAQPLRIWLYNSGDVPIIGLLLKEAWVAYAMSWAGAAFDLTIVGWLLWRRSRPIAYAILVVFHVMTWLLFPIGMFPWIMIAATLIFFPPDWPVRLYTLLGGRRLALTRYTAPAAFTPEAGNFPVRWRVGAVGLALFALLQVVMPLRHFAYPGNVRWNEEGYRFAWRVMLTEKVGYVRFRVTDAATGEQWLRYPEEFLTALQTERIAYQPDMILATAHIIAQDERRKGRNVEVQADAFVTFNGRRAAQLIDPTVDLARVNQGILPKAWVLPAPTGP
ncbi:MAG: HTTM domain-containing protein [Chloroflexota bacterium]|nr:HTTM domain-containing protein [Chloroflexota bacterium]MDE2841565.1 HTTM domain-containing protein [Chloroflexota bacterium]MDE2931961.1 HTTM domain-containing protein [Chloroflexota bacterium]